MSKISKKIEEIEKFESITKGWSEDKKYCVTTKYGEKYLLRITPISRYQDRKLLFSILEQVSALNIPMCNPIEFGTYDDETLLQGGVYSLQSWIYGDDLEEVLPLMSKTEQYVLGLKSGAILRKIHSIPAPKTQEEWAFRFNKKIDRNINAYTDCKIQFNSSELVLAYIEKNRHLLENRPQSFQHGDYHVGNMMIENGELKIIDFDRFDFGDPWEEFNRITWCAQASSHFATGMVDGYFDKNPPEIFWKLLALYISSNMLASVPWAISFGQDEIDTMLRQATDVLSWYDNMENPLPTWYLKDIGFVVSRHLTKID